MNSNQRPRLHLTRRPKNFKENTLYPILPPSESAMSIYTDVLIATIPLFLLSVYYYGFRTLTVALISAVMMLGFDVAVKTVMKKESRFDLAPAMNGAIIALFLPASAPLWLPVMTAALATAIALIPTKRVKISLSPVLLSVILAFLLFPGIMNVIPKTGQMLNPFAFSLKSFEVIQSSPLDTVLSGFLPDATTFETFFGLIAARIGEISGLLIMVAFLYLLTRKSAKLLLPASFVLTVGIFAYLNPSLEAASDFIALDGAVYNIFGSNTFLVAAFLLSQPQRSARTPLGTAIAGVLGGLTTMLLRGHIAVGLTALIAVALIDLILPIIDQFLKPMPFGGTIAPKKEENKIEQ